MSIEFHSSRNVASPKFSPFQVKQIKDQDLKVEDYAHNVLQGLNAHYSQVVEPLVKYVNIHLKKDSYISIETLRDSTRILEEIYKKEQESWDTIIKAKNNLNSSKYGSQINTQISRVESGYQQTQAEYFIEKHLLQICENYPDLKQKFFELSKFDKREFLATLSSHIDESPQHSYEKILKISQALLQFNDKVASKIDNPDEWPDLRKFYLILVIEKNETFANEIINRLVNLPTVENSWKHPKVKFPLTAYENLSEEILDPYLQKEKSLYIDELPIKIKRWETLFKDIPPSQLAKIPYKRINEILTVFIQKPQLVKRLCALDLTSETLSTISKRDLPFFNETLLSLAESFKDDPITVESLFDEQILWSNEIDRQKHLAFFDWCLSEIKHTNNIDEMCSLISDALKMKIFNVDRAKILFDVPVDKQKAYRKIIRAKSEEDVTRIVEQLELKKIHEENKFPVEMIENAVEYLNEILPELKGEFTEWLQEIHKITTFEDTITKDPVEIFELLKDEKKEMVLTCVAKLIDFNSFVSKGEITKEEIVNLFKLHKKIPLGLSKLFRAININSITRNDLDSLTQTLNRCSDKFMLVIFDDLNIGSKLTKVIRLIKEGKEHQCDLRQLEQYIINNFSDKNFDKVHLPNDLKGFLEIEKNADYQFSYINDDNKSVDINPFVDKLLNNIELRKLFEEYAESTISGEDIISLFSEDVGLLNFFLTKMELNLKDCLTIMKFNHVNNIDVKNISKELCRSLISEINIGALPSTIKNILSLRDQEYTDENIVTLIDHRRMDTFQNFDNLLSMLIDHPNSKLSAITKILLGNSGMDVFGYINSLLEKGNSNAIIEKIIDTGTLSTSDKNILKAYVRCGRGFVETIDAIINNAAETDAIKKTTTLFPLLTEGKYDIAEKMWLSNHPRLKAIFNIKNVETYELLFYLYSFESDEKILNLALSLAENGDTKTLSKLLFHSSHHRKQLLELISLNKNADTIFHEMITPNDYLEEQVQITGSIPRAIAKTLTTTAGFVNTALISDLLNSKIFDSPQIKPYEYSHYKRMLDYFESDHNLGSRLSDIPLPKQKSAIERLTRKYLDLKPEEEISINHIHELVLSGIFTPTRQGDVGSCFSTCIMIQMDSYLGGVKQKIEDYIEMINSNKISRSKTVLGNTVSVDYPLYVTDLLNQKEFTGDHYLNRAREFTLTSMGRPLSFSLSENNIKNHSKVLQNIISIKSTNTFMKEYIFFFNKQFEEEYNRVFSYMFSACKKPPKGSSKTDLGADVLINKKLGTPILNVEEYRSSLKEIMKIIKNKSLKQFPKDVESIEKCFDVDTGILGWLDSVSFMKHTNAMNIDNSWVKYDSGGNTDTILKKYSEENWRPNRNYALSLSSKNNFLSIFSYLQSLPTVTKKFAKMNTELRLPLFYSGTGHAFSITPSEPLKLLKLKGSPLQKYKSFLKEGSEWKNRQLPTHFHENLYDLVKNDDSVQNKTLPLVAILPKLINTHSLREFSSELEKNLIDLKIDNEQKDTIYEQLTDFIYQIPSLSKTAPKAIIFGDSNWENNYQLGYVINPLTGLPQEAHIDEMSERIRIADKYYCDKSGHSRWSYYHNVMTFNDFHPGLRPNLR
ncbi:MAG: hypothetical protein VX777_02265 [Chlamydiota bacterium]|nr:hypothetical protein [Chlamydiota bacterium]